MAEFATEAVLSLDHVAIENDAAAITRTHNVGNRGLAAVRAKDRVVAPKRCRVGVVQVRNRLSQLAGQALADIKPCPLRMHKVRRPTRAQPSSRTRWTRSVEANGDHVVEGNA